MLRKFSPAILLVILIMVFAWSPWHTEASAQAHAINSFNQAWEFVADGCGTICKGCGAVSSRRVPFGMLVTIEYACGLIPADVPEYHRQSTAFVSALGTVHGFPRP